MLRSKSFAFFAAGSHWCKRGSKKSEVDHEEATSALVERVAGLHRDLIALEE